MELKLNIKLNYVLLPAGVLVGAIMAVGLTSMADGPELDSGPRAIPYNGILEFNGQSLNGQADLMFALTDVPGGEGANCYFEEEHDNVTAYSGRFSVNIGQVTGSLPDCVFDSDEMYIEVGVRDATSDGEYVPLSGSQRIHPVPFAYWAAEGSDFKVDGDLTLAGSLSNPSVDGNGDDLPVSIDDDLDLTGNIDVTGAIANTSVDGNNDGLPVSIDDDLDLTGRAYIPGDGSNDHASLTGDGLLTLGQLNGPNLTMDGNEIVARDNGAHATLYLQEADGGPIDARGSMTVRGNVNIDSGEIRSTGTTVTVNDALDVKNNTTIGYDGTGNLTVNGSLTVTGSVTGLLEEGSYLHMENSISGDGIIPLSSYNDHWCFLTRVDSDIDCSVVEGGTSAGVTYWELRADATQVGDRTNTCTAICISR